MFTTTGKDGSTLADDAQLIHLQHELICTRARVAGLLDTRINSLLTVAAEALTSDPPRIRVALERIDIAQELLRDSSRKLRQDNTDVIGKGR